MVEASSTAQGIFTTEGNPMPVAASISAVFGHFQNLNLLSLVQDLRRGETTRRGWFSPGALLCPVAHGLPDGDQVRALGALGQTADLAAGCAVAARHLGAAREAVYRFVCLWDEGVLASDWLMHQLEEIWEERLTDAHAMQQVLHAPSDCASSLEQLLRIETLGRVGGGDEYGAAMADLPGLHRDIVLPR
jgi:hypothetical protein